MGTAITIPAFTDNLIYLYKYSDEDVLAVDPGEGSAVLRFIQNHGLNLTTILATHHHWDHTAAIAELKNETGCQVIGCDGERIRGIDRVITGGQQIALGCARITAIATPGHTRTSVCYYMDPTAGGAGGILWTGDTLFVGGCGRLLECDAQSMWESLLQLASLPDDTLIYCGHDYTIENYEFALTIEPGNQAVARLLQLAREALKSGGFAVPSTVLQERQTNIFLRAGSAEVTAAVGMAGEESVKVFAELRRRKDLF